MSLWEQHKQIFIVAGTFLAALFLIWLFVLRGYAHEVSSKRKAYEEELEDQREKLCPEEGPKVAILQTAYEKANQALTKELETLGEQLRFEFEEPLIPEKEKRRRQLFVRDQLDKLKDYVALEVETKRQRRIELSEQASTLGFTMPNDLNESQERDLIWLQQMAVVRRVVDTLMQVYEEKDEARGITIQHLLGILRIQPRPPVKTGTQREKFVMEYPVELELLITLRGLMKLLDLCSAEESFHIVQRLNVISKPESRVSKLAKRKLSATRGERWYTHYYRVELILAAMTLFEEEEVEDTEPQQSKPKPQIIPH